MCQSGIATTTHSTPVTEVALKSINIAPNTEDRPLHWACLNFYMQGCTILPQNDPQRLICAFKRLRSDTA